MRRKSSIYKIKHEKTVGNIWWTYEHLMNLLGDKFKIEYFTKYSTHCWAHCHRTLQQTTKGCKKQPDGSTNHDHAWTFVTSGPRRPRTADCWYVWAKIIVAVFRTAYRQHSYSHTTSCILGKYWPVMYFLCLFYAKNLYKQSSSTKRLV